MITMDNYEGWLMRYADGELTDTEHAAVEAFLTEHPDLCEEMEEVAAVKVLPPVAVMPHKERLVRKTVVPVWGRVAAAVAVAVVAVWLTMPTGKPSGTMTAMAPKEERMPAEKPQDTVTEMPAGKLQGTATAVREALPVAAPQEALAMADLEPETEPEGPIAEEKGSLEEIVPVIIETNRLAVVAPTIVVEEGYVVDVQLTTTPMQTVVRGLLALKEE